MAGKPRLQPYNPKEVRPGVSMRQERLIGRVCVAWADLEAATQDVLLHTLDLPMTDARSIAAGADGDDRLRRLNPLAQKHLEEGEFGRIKVILENIDFFRQERNLIVHGSWFTYLRSGEPVVMASRERTSDPTEVVAEAFPPDRMERIWRGVELCRVSLMAWANAHATSRGNDPPYPWIAGKS